MKYAFVKQALDPHGPWASYAWTPEDPTGIFRVWPSKATLWEMTAALQADWYVIPQSVETDHIRASSRKYASLADALERYVSNVIPCEQIPWEAYDVVITFDPVLLSARLPKAPLYAYYMGEHWDSYYKGSMKDPLGEYDLFLDHMMSSPHSVTRLPQVISFPYLRDPQLVRSIFPARKEERLWLDWRVISLLAETDFWNERCPQVAQAFGESIGVETGWKAFGATPMGIENPPRWGDALDYLKELSRCRYYAAIGRVHGAGQGLCDAASLNCICFGEPEKAYHSMVCHPRCLCRSIEELAAAVKFVAASGDLQEEILAWQTERLKTLFWAKPLALLEAARRGKITAAAALAQRGETPHPEKSLEEIRAEAERVEERYPHRALLFIGSESYDAPVITLLQGLQALGFTIYTLFKSNINAWFCGTVITDLAGVKFDFVLSNLQWGTRWSYYRTYGLEDCLKVLVDGSGSPPGTDLDWRGKNQRLRLEYVNDPAEAVKMLDCQPYRWIEALDGYNPDVVFTTQKSHTDRESYYLPFGIQNEALEFGARNSGLERDLAFSHIPGPGSSRERMQTWLDEMEIAGDLPPALWKDAAHGEVVYPPQVQSWVQKDAPRNVHSWFRWGLDRTYYRVLNRTNVLIYPGVDEDARWESRRPWEAYAAGCLVLMQKPDIDTRDYPPEQICVQAVYTTRAEFSAKLKDLAARPGECEQLRLSAVERAREFFSPVPLARTFLKRVLEKAQAHGKAPASGLHPARPRTAAGDLPRVTLFAMPKAFRGNNAVIQRNAVLSWTALKPRPEIILFGEEEGIQEICLELGLRHVPKIARNEHGTPLVNALLERGEIFGAEDILVYVNADILLLSDFLPALNKTANAFSQFLMIGQRFDLDYTEALDVTRPDWENTIRVYASANGSLHSQTGMDYFAFRRGVWKDIPAFAIGRTAWDNWLVYQPLSRGIPVVDATEAVFAIHQNHDWSHMAGGQTAAWTGYEARRNRNLAMGTPVCSVADCTWKVTPTGVGRVDPVLPWFKEGMEYLKKGLPHYALARFLDIIQQEPGLPNAYYGCAVALFQQGNLNEAVSACRAELALQPGNPAVLNLLEKIEEAQQRNAAPA